MKNKFFLICTMLIFVCLNSCKDIIKGNTTLQIKDNNRHYYPVILGQELNMVFQITNTGKNPFVLKDIMTSCGCVTLKKSSINNIPPGEERLLLIKYNSEKNIGLVNHFITLYGNFATTDRMEITFDVHVVPPSSENKDYEEIYQDEKDKNGGVEDMVDGGKNNKGYYLDPQ
jgi:hypothetical protein